MACVVVSTQPVCMAHCSECGVYFLIPAELDAMHEHEDSMHPDWPGADTCVATEEVPFILGSRWWY